MSDPERQGGGSGDSKSLQIFNTKIKYATLEEQQKWANLILTKDELNFFAYLGAFAIHPGTFNLKAIMSVSGVNDPLKGKRIMDMLCNLGLVNQEEGDRYSISRESSNLAESFLTKDEE